jgi:hypothetical protein
MTNDFVNMSVKTDNISTDKITIKVRLSVLTDAGFVTVLS